MAVTLASLQAQFALVETQMALYKAMLLEYAQSTGVVGSSTVPSSSAPKPKNTSAEVPATVVAEKPKRVMSDTTRLALKAAAAFSDMLVEREAEAYAKYLESQKALPKTERDGVNLKGCFTKKYKDAHKDEYDAFVSQYKESHSSVASDDETTQPTDLPVAVATADPVVPTPAQPVDPTPAQPVVPTATAAPKPKLKIKAKPKTQPTPAQPTEFVSTQRMTHNGQEVIVDATGNMYKDEGDMGPGEFMGVYNRSTGHLDSKAKEIV